MSFLLVTWEYIVVFVLAAIPWIEIGVVIPLALIKGLNPWIACVVSFSGNLSTIYLLIIFYEKYEQWKEKKYGKNEEQQSSRRAKRAVQIWDKYGLPGLALVAPLLIGSHLAVIMGIAFGADKRHTLFWITVSLVIWSVAITILSYYGIDFLGII